MDKNHFQKIWEDEKKETLIFFEGFGLEVELSELLKEIHSMSSEKQSELFYLLYKIRNIFDICDYVDKKKKEKYVDCERFKMFLLVSYAENVARLSNVSNDPLRLINKFFCQVKSKLKYAIDPNKFIKSRMELLYAFRNEYAHMGNTSGHIFRINIKREDKNYKQLGSVGYFDKENKKTEEIIFSVDISYDEFRKIYLEALIIQIKNIFKIT